MTHGGARRESAVSDTEADEMEEHLRGSATGILGPRKEAEMRNERRSRRAVATIAVATLMLVGTAGTAEAKKDTVRVEAFEFGFNLPDFEAGKFKLEFANIGTGPHMFAAAEVPEGVTAEEVIADESLIIRDVAFAFALPGETTKGKLKKLTPGNYAFACFVETPAGVPHFALGMLGEFQVA
jgi:hypothetical protein